MVDRVCTGCEVSGEGVNVIAEPWRGSIVVLDPKLHGRRPPNPHPHPHPNPHKVGHVDCGRGKGVDEAEP